MAYLILVRHGESEWNALGKWAGLTDVALTPEGRQEARRAAENLRTTPIAKAHVSTLTRAQQTLDEITRALQLSDIPVHQSVALNERDYGDLTGKEKAMIEQEYGKEQRRLWTRSWDHPVPNGETLKDVHDRVVPYYEQHIVDDLKRGHNVLVVSHHNTLRALMKYLEQIPEDEIHTLELGTSEIRMYEIDDAGMVRTSATIAGNAANRHQA